MQNKQYMYNQQVNVSSNLFFSFNFSEFDSDFGCRGAISLHKATIKVSLIG